MIALKTILVPVDFSDCSESALERARALAVEFNASLHLLHVVTEPFHETWIYFAPGIELADMLKEYQDKSRSSLESLATTSEISSGRVVVATEYGNPSDEILRYAGDHHADLIVCGTHGRRGWNRFMLGSVAERVVRLARCPVMTVLASSARAVSVA